MCTGTDTDLHEAGQRLERVVIEVRIARILGHAVQDGRDLRDDRLRDLGGRPTMSNMHGPQLRAELTDTTDCLAMEHTRRMAVGGHASVCMSDSSRARRVPLTSHDVAVLRAVLVFKRCARTHPSSQPATSSQAALAAPLKSGVSRSLSMGAICSGVMRTLPANAAALEVTRRTLL